jgi:hypothetical protein
MLHPLQQAQQVTQPVFPPMQADDSAVPLVDLQLQNDDIIGGFRRPLNIYIYIYIYIYICYHV